MTGEFSKKTITEDAEVFMAFQKHREKFLILLQSGAFDIVGGQLEVNIINGQIQTIHIHNMTYKRPSAPQKGALY